jgi:hypothetical protein
MKKENEFVVCINNKGYESSLEFGKIYKVVPNKEAEKEGLICIIDESGEDYAYTLDRFYEIAVSQKLENVLLAA